jgi:hypothetical protein
MSILTGIYVIATGYYAYVSRETLKAIERQAKATEDQAVSNSDQFTKELTAMGESRQQTAGLIEQARNQVQALIAAGETALTHANATLLLVERATDSVKFAELNAEAAKENAIAAKVAADAALLNSKAIMDAERARIVCSFKSKENFHSLSISNCGRTPAHIVDVKFIRTFPNIAENFNSHLPDEPDYGLPTEFLHARILCAGDTWEAPDWSMMVSSSELTEELLKEITNGPRRYYVFGRVEYRDVFRNDTKHETRFCFFYSPPLRTFIIGGPREYTKYT